jgi:hypothetical protein
MNIINQIQQEIHFILQIILIQENMEMVEKIEN